MEKYFICQDCNAKVGIELPTHACHIITCQCKECGSVYEANVADLFTFEDVMDKYDFKENRAIIGDYEYINTELEVGVRHETEFKGTLYEKEWLVIEYKPTVFCAGGIFYETTCFSNKLLLSEVDEFNGRIGIPVSMISEFMHKSIETINAIRNIINPKKQMTKTVQPVFVSDCNGSIAPF